MAVNRNPTWSSLTVLLLAAGICGQDIVPAENSYEPTVDKHRFGGVADRIVSRADRRLLLQAEGTLEVHLKREWQDDAPTALLYCIAYVGGRKAPPARSAVDSSSGGGSGTEVVDPYAETQEAAAAAHAKGVVANKQDARVFWPRYAIYISNDALYLQTGDRIQRCLLTKAARLLVEAKNQAVHFVFTFSPRRIVVHAAGHQCARFEQPNLVPLDGIEPLADHAIDQIVLGTRPTGKLGACHLFKDVGGEMVKQSSAYDLGRWLKNFRGELGGVRVWSRAFDETCVTVRGKDPAFLSMRGAEDVARSIAFPEARERVRPPNYGDLICFSSFFGKRHRMRSQFPVSGNWVNAGLTSRVMGDSQKPSGLGDTYGNVEDVPLITVVRTDSPADWLVYQDADLAGFLHLEPQATTGEFTVQASNPKLRIPVELELDRDQLRFSLPKAGTLFGGDNRRAANIVTLKRPSLAWLGTPVRKDDAFFAGHQIKYVRVLYRAFDITDMDPLHAYQAKTGSTRDVFAEPRTIEYRWNPHNIVVPFYYHYCPVDESRSASDSFLVHSERDYMTAFAGHVGVWTDSPHVAFSVDVQKRYKEQLGKSKSTSIAITKSIAKDYALVLNRSQLRLSADFLDAVDRLANGIREGKSQPAGAAFIEAFGTHFAMSATFGGMWVHQRTVETTEIHKSIESGTGMEAQLSGGIRSGPGVELAGRSETGTKVKFSFDNGSISKDGQTSGRSTFWVIPGGKYIPASEPTTVQVDNPAPLFYDLRPLSELLTPANFEDPFYYHEVREHLRTEIRAYLDAASRRSGGKGFDLVPTEPTETESLATVVRVGVPLNFRGRVILSGVTEVNGKKQKVEVASQQLAAKDQWWVNRWRRWASSGARGRPPRQNHWIGLRKPPRGRSILADKVLAKVDRLQVRFDGEVFVDRAWHKIHMAPPSPLHTNPFNRGGRAGHLVSGDFPQFRRPPRTINRTLRAWITRPPIIYRKGFRVMVKPRGGLMHFPRYFKPPAIAFQATVLLQQKRVPKWYKPQTLDNLRDYMNEIEARRGQRISVPPGPQTVVRRPSSGWSLGSVPGADKVPVAKWVKGRTRLSMELMSPDRRPAAIVTQFYQAARSVKGRLPQLAKAVEILDTACKKGLPGGSFFLRNGDSYLGLAVPGQPQAQDITVRARVCWSNRGSKKVGFLPLPVQVVNGELVSAVPELPLKLGHADGKQLHWVRSGAGERVEVLRFGVPIAAGK